MRRSLLLSILVSLFLNQAFAATATFVEIDTATQGSWKGKYGGDGFVRLGLTDSFFSSLPTYATIAGTGKSDFTWAATTTDVRGLQKHGGTTDRVSGCWFADTTFDIDITMTGNLTHRVALYCADWDSATRRQRFQVMDGATVLDTRDFNFNFNGGAWVVWDISGSVKIRVTEISGGAPNVVVAGVFFGGATPGPSLDTIWFDDATPPGANLQGDYAWNFVTSNPSPYSGAASHQSTIAGGTHQHFFTQATTLFPIGVGERLIAHVFLDPANPPTQIMLQWNDGAWEHRAYWGANSIPFGTDGTVSRYLMGPLPALGQWVRLEVPAAFVGLENKSLNGIAFTIFNGRATWDRPGKSVGCALSISPTNPSISTGRTQQFTTNLTSLAGTTLTPQTPLDFSVTGGGTINSSGLFTAGMVPGTYTVTASTDKATATVNATIQVTNFAPTSVADSYTVTQNRTRTIAAPGVLNNDTDPENDTLTAILDTNVSNGTLTLNANGSFTYTPNNGYLGTDSFTYHARDTINNNAAPVTVTFNVVPSVAPVATTTTTLFVNEDSSNSGVVTATDANGDPITYIVITPPTKGTVTFANASSGIYLYVPNPNATGTDSFTVGAMDDSGLVGAAGVTTVTILPINDAPVAVSSSIQTGNNQAKSGTVSATDVDSTTFQYILASQPANGSVTFNTTTGAFVYTPNTNFTGNDSFTFRASDGALTSAPGTVSILVTPGPAFSSLPVLTPNPVLAGQSVVASSSSPSAVSIVWNWGDGSTGTGSSTSHTWAAAGLYTVTVVATGADGVSTIVTTEVFVASTLEGAGASPGAATPPGVVGILVGGSGSNATAKGTGKIVCNYVKREKTTYSASLTPLGLPATLTQAELANLPSTLKIGPLNAPATFRFDLNAKGKGKATGLPQVEVNVKKKRFKFKAQREDLTALTETLGAPREFAANGKTVELLVPVTVQIGNKVLLAMTFRVNYKHTANGGRGTLAK